MAWLNATPEKAECPRRETYTEGSPYLELPLLSEYEQSLVGYWFEAGTVEQTGSGLTSLSWQEIVAWANQFYKQPYVEFVEHPRHSNRHKRTYTPVVIDQCALLDWELQMIKKLSQEYAAEYSQASSPSRECPKVIFLDEVSEDDALANANAMADAFKTMFGSDSSGPSVEVVKNT